MQTRNRRCALAASNDARACRPVASVAPPTRAPPDRSSAHRASAPCRATCGEQAVAEMPAQLVERDAGVGLRYRQPLGRPRHALRPVDLDEYVQPVDIELGHAQRYQQNGIRSIRDRRLYAIVGQARHWRAHHNGDNDNEPQHPRTLPVLVAGGGIGGLAAALALTRQGFRVKVLEQARSSSARSAPASSSGPMPSRPSTRSASASRRAAARSTPTRW